eukprot:gene8318-10334_t
MATAGARLTAVYAGGAATFVVSRKGAVYAAGENLSGQLGVGKKSGAGVE